jgi:hypothetical protein
MVDEIDQPPSVEEGVGSGLLSSLIDEGDLQAAVEKRRLTQSGSDDVVVELEGL